eukprot:830146-Prymnesium_polylepis.2
MQLRPQESILELDLSNGSSIREFDVMGAGVRAINTHPICDSYRLNSIKLSMRWGATGPAPAT